MTYQAPVADIRHTLKHIAGLDKEIERGMFGDLDADLVDAILEEAGKFAAEELAPLNAIGDKQGSHLKDGKVTVPEGWAEAYNKWVEAGWGSLPGPVEYGGQGLPAMLAMAVDEIWNSASLAFSLAPLLTQGAMEAIHVHGADELKARFLPKLVSGEWTGTMNLTEPQAGSDLALLRAKAVPQGDGGYRISGTKIFITYGDHEMTDNIVHLVLARLPDAPPGTKGISLFVVPKYLVNDDGSKGAVNDVVCAGVEHKLGIHASPTCVMSFGDGDGAVGFLLGEENRGLNCMFTMMNRARLGVGIQGVSICERAFQQALAYAHERKQGNTVKAPGETAFIVEHPDIRRSLLSMKSLTAASRAICYLTAREIDISERSTDQKEKKLAAGRAALLTPLAKAFSTDAGVEVASIGVQVHGGMGYVEETGAAQHLRDARILPIYEGTNGIQAIDLVARKLPMANGEVVQGFLNELRDIAEEVMGRNEPGLGRAGYRLSNALENLEEATGFMLKALAGDPNEALAGATPYLELFSLTTGAALLAKGALAAAGSEEESAFPLVRYFAENHLVAADGLRRTVTSGAASVLDTGADPLKV